MSSQYIRVILRSLVSYLIPCDNFVLLTTKSSFKEYKQIIFFSVIFVPQVVNEHKDFWEQGKPLVYYLTEIRPLASKMEELLSQ